jgi:hypothetical protein
MSIINTGIPKEDNCSERNLNGFCLPVPVAPAINMAV